MTKDGIALLHAQGRLRTRLAVQNPSNAAQWTAFFTEQDGCGHFLVDKRDQVVVFDSLDQLARALRDMGMTHFEVNISARG